MNRTKIEWTNYTWNPIRGICPVGCWYCYARRIYKRFKIPSYITFHPKELEKPYSLRSKSKIFACSTIELFHSAISEKWRNMIFRVIKDLPQHTFQILTKFPQNIDRPMPDNVWLGVSVTGHNEVDRIETLSEMQAKIKFVSIEPFLNPIYISAEYFLQRMNWIIIGRLTGHGKKHDPRLASIEGIESFAKNREIPIFLKNNLKEIWGEPLIQEFPND